MSTINFQSLNQEKIKEKNREYIRNNKDRVNARQREYRQENLEKKRLYQNIEI